MVSAATRTLSQVAASQAGLVKYFSYHWSDQPGGGKVRNLAELKEMGTITNMGGGGRGESSPSACRGRGSRCPSRPGQPAPPRNPSPAPHQAAPSRGPQ